jgi:hypothetical protein
MSKGEIARELEPAVLADGDGLVGLVGLVEALGESGRDLMVCEGLLASAEVELVLPRGDNETCVIDLI